MDILSQLKRDEGLRLTPYSDPVGKLTIGYGRNLDDEGISQDEAEYFLANDLARVKADMGLVLPWTAKLDEVRLGVLQNMAFNLGMKGLLEFENTLALVNEGNYQQAAIEMVRSKWATQTGKRAERLSRQMATGIWQ